MGEDRVEYFPAWETLPHERLSPRADTVGRRLAVLRRLAGQGRAAAPQRGRRADPLGAAAAGQGPGRHGPGADRGGADLRTRTAAGRPDRRRLQPRRPGGAARRVRGARRHRRRLPAHRRAPLPRRLLRRRGGRDPLLHRRRPALHRRHPELRRLPAVPRTAAHPAGQGTGQGARHGAPRAERHARPDRRGPGRRGHGGAHPGAGGRLELLVDVLPKGSIVLASSPGADPRPRRRTRADQPGVPGGQLGCRGRRRHLTDRPRGLRLLEPRRRACSTPWTRPRWWSLVPFAADDDDDEAAALRRRLGARRDLGPSETFRGDTEAATRHIAARRRRLARDPRRRGPWPGAAA